MSLYKKFALLFSAIILVILAATLSVVYSQSRDIMVQQARQKAVTIIQTIDSALESNLPDFQFESILLHLQKQDPAILSFDIYKLNGYYYDIASTDPKRIGQRANPKNFPAPGDNRTQSTLHGTRLTIVAPILINGETLYSSVVQYGMTGDLAFSSRLLARFLLVGLAAALLAAAAVWIMGRRLLSYPLLRITGAANDIAVGNLGIDLRGLDARRDEIGMLARSFLRMANHLQEILSGISSTSEELNRAFQDLVASGDYTAHGALHVTDVMNHMTRRMDEQIQTVEAMTRTFAGLAQRMEAVNSCAQDAQDFSERVQDSIAALTADIADASEGIRQLAQQTRETGSHLQTIAATVNGQLGSIQEANRAAARLSQMALELQKLTSVFDSM